MTGKQHVSPYYQFASRNGEIVFSEDIPVPQTEKGIFTTIKVREGIPLFMPDHIARLQQGVSKLALQEQDFAGLEDEISAVVQKNAVQEAAVRITIFDGTRLIHERPLPQGSAIATVTVADTRKMQEKVLKVIDRTKLNLATEEAHRASATDALLTDERGIAESTLCNIFSVNNQGEIITPPIAGRGLNGIARQIFMRTISVKQEDILETTSHPIVLTNSLRMSTVTSIDGRQIANGNKLLEKLQEIREQTERTYLNQKHHAT